MEYTKEMLVDDFRTVFILFWYGFWGYFTPIAEYNATL